MGTYKFDAKSMNSVLEVSVCHESENYAKSAALDLFDEIEKLEDILSMFRDGSDICAINALKPGESCRILEITAQALAGAMYASSLSGGCLDVCMGEFFLAAKGIEKIENPRRAKFALDPDSLTVEKLEEGKIDLGAVGKGFALEVLAERLSQMWGINSAMLSFGSSMVLMNPPEGRDSWEVTFAGREIPGLKLSNVSIGSSGTAVQGEHIIDCRTGRPPENAPFRSWSISSSAMLCDAMSTAFMALPRPEILRICAAENMRAALQASPDSDIEFLN